MKSNRKRNIARKAKSNRIRTGSVSAPPISAPQSGFVSQNPPSSNYGVRDSSPQAGSREPEAGSGFVSQNAQTPTSDLQNSSPEAGLGFVSQNQPSSNDGVRDSSPEAGSREPEAGSGFVSQNRANAQHSTGPRTPEGKAASAQNAFKHGLSIQRHAVLRDEDPAAYAQLLSELRQIYVPRSRREDLAVEDVAQCRWALQRFDEAEAISLQKLTDSFNDPVDFEGAEIIGAGESLALAATVLTDVDEKDRSFVEPDETYPTFEKIHRYRTHWERKHTRALAEFDRAQRSRHAEANQARAEAKEARAEAQAQRQAEVHALKQELALAREAQPANGFVSQNPPSPTYGVRNSPPEAGSREPEAGAPLAQLESLLNAPTPITEQEFLRTRAAQSTNGFVSQNPPAPNYGV